MKNTDAGLLLVRIALAVVFLMHGIMKLKGLGGTVGFFGSLGLPAVVAYGVAVVETLGGLSMLLGIFSEIFGALLALVMMGAIYFVHAQNGYGGKGGYEFPLMVFLCAVAIACTGAGKYSLKRILSGSTT